MTDTPASLGSELMSSPIPSPQISRWTAVCGSRDCKTGWMQLWRSRACPRFEGKWACSAACMERIVADSIRSQIESWHESSAERPLRMPLGLILLSRGWISRQELQDALAAQRRAQEGKIGKWLRRLHGISEESIAKALAIQWNCTVLLSKASPLEWMPAMLPVFLQRRYQLALVRQGTDATAYLAGRYRAENAASRAVESMLDSPVQAAFLEDSAWTFAGTAETEAPDTTEIIVPGREGAAACIAALVERSRPSDARLVRIHDHLWLRLWHTGRSKRPLPLRNVVLPLRVREHEDELLRVD